MDNLRPKGVPTSPARSTNGSKGVQESPSSDPTLPYPQYSILEDGYAGKFRPQILGQPGRDRLYSGWITISLQPCPGTDVPLQTLFDHLHTSLTPPPGIPLINNTADLLPHLTRYQAVVSPGQQDGLPPHSLESASSTTSTLVLKDVALRQPTFEETSEVWKSVGMSLLRWALLAMGKAGGSALAQATSPAHSEWPLVTGNPLMAGPSASPLYHNGPSTSASRESDDASHQPGNDAGLSDSAFTILHSSLLPYPELSLRRSFADKETEKSGTSVPDTMESAAIAVEMENREAGKSRKKAYWAKQTLGIEGSLAVAKAWLRAATVENPAENHYTTIESAYHLYRAYGYHPFQCPRLDIDAFIQVVIGGSSSGDREGWSGKSWYDVTDEAGLAGNPTHQAGSSSHAKKLPTLIGVTLKSPESMLVKEHESIWESVGMSWKKARAYEWNESRLVDTRERETAAKTAKGEEKRRRVLKSVDCQPEANESASNRRRKTKMTTKIPPKNEVHPPVPRTDGHSAGPRPLQRVEMQVPRRPDFVIRWFASTFRRAPPMVQITQRDMWQAYSAIVQAQSAKYEMDLARFLAIRQGLIERKEFEIFRLEGERLSEIHRMLEYYVALQPADLFHLVINRFGCTLGRGPSGEYTLDGLEAIPMTRYM